MSVHHPDEMLLLEYSAGSLTEPHALCIRLHLDRCPRCQGQLEIMNYLGSAVLEDRHQQVDLSAGLFSRISARLDEEPAPPTRGEPEVARSELLKGLIEARVDFETLPWKRQLGDVSACDISDQFGAIDERVTLQRLPAGGKAPTHTHRGRETTIVLQGAFCDNNGVFEAGDFVVLDPTHVHKPVALHGDHCISLSVLTAPVKLTGTFSRLLNPFIR
jgi:putative transcriptional regulator